MKPDAELQRIRSNELGHGYREVARAGQLVVGGRVCNVNDPEQRPGTVLAVFVHPRHGGVDVVVRVDDPVDGWDPVRAWPGPYCRPVAVVLDGAA